MAATEFTDSQRIIVNILSYCPISVTEIEKHSGTTYRLKASSKWRQLIYILFVLNTIIKFIYLLFLVMGYFGPVEFLDKMCALLWILMCAEILQELLFFGQVYPLYEVLISIYKHENEIYNKLRKPISYMMKCRRTNINTLVLHTAILIVGCIFIGVQFTAFPKYSVYTYSAFKEDNAILLIIFTCHEVGFMWYAWSGYLGIVTLSCLNAVELTCIMDAMSAAFSKIFPTHNPRSKIRQRENHKIFGEINVGLLVDIKMSKRLEIDPLQVCPGTEYLIEELINDYNKLMFASDLLNDWCGYRLVGIHIIGYCQFVTDVFMMIQLLRLPDIDVVSTLWFGEDAIVCLYMMFRVFTLMSRVVPASENFKRQFHHYLRFENPSRKKLRKVSKALRLVSLKLGPCPVRPVTVGRAIMMLMNYYLCVALWKF